LPSKPAGVIRGQARYCLRASCSAWPPPG
jgi:hypothetical protein